MTVCGILWHAVILTAAVCHSVHFEVAAENMTITVHQINVFETQTSDVTPIGSLHGESNEKTDITSFHATEMVSQGPSSSQTNILRTYISSTHYISIDSSESQIMPSLSVLHKTISGSALPFIISTSNNETLFPTADVSNIPVTQNVIASTPHTDSIFQSSTVPNQHLSESYNKSAQLYTREISDSQLLSSVTPVVQSFSSQTENENLEVTTDLVSAKESTFMSSSQINSDQVTSFSETTDIFSTLSATKVGTSEYEDVTSSFPLMEIIQSTDFLFSVTGSFSTVSTPVITLAPTGFVTSSERTEIPFTSRHFSQTSSQKIHVSESSSKPFHSDSSEFIDSSFLIEISSSMDVLPIPDTSEEISIESTIFQSDHFRSTNFVDLTSVKELGHITTTRYEPMSSLLVTTILPTPVDVSTGTFDGTITDHIQLSSAIPEFTVRNISFEMEFDGMCDPLVNQKMALKQFWKELLFKLSVELDVQGSSIRPKDLACNPIRISFTIVQQGRSDISSKLDAVIASKEFKLQVHASSGFTSDDIYEYTAVSVKVVPASYNIVVKPEYQHLGLSRVDIIVIIAACCISMVLILLGCCICAKEYYLRKRASSFDVANIANLNSNLEDYTLTKIPRPRAYYGTDNGVTMQSFTSSNGQHVRADKAKDGMTENGADVIQDVQIRMKEHNDGIVIGVTTTPKTNRTISQQDHVASNGETGDQSKEILYRPSSSPTNSVDNPVYFADDDSIV